MPRNEPAVGRRFSVAKAPHSTPATTPESLDSVVFSGSSDANNASASARSTSTEVNRCSDEDSDIAAKEFFGSRVSLVEDNEESNNGGMKHNLGS